MDQLITILGFAGSIRAADAISMASPEHNYSIPGVIKNAIDWASRPSGDNSLNGKPVGIMSASPGCWEGQEGNTT